MLIYKLGIVLAFSGVLASNSLTAINSFEVLDIHNSSLTILSKSEEKNAARDQRKFKIERKKKRLLKKKNKFPSNLA
jgi:hypothetical protein